MNRRKQRGYLLITVVVMLFLLATIAVLLTHGSAIGANSSNKELETDRVEYVAQAGMQHALWQAGNNACMGTATIPVTTLGNDTYTATLSGAATGTFHDLAADQDAWIRNDQPTTNKGGDSSLHIKDSQVEQPLYRFDLSSLPAGSQINSAVASFYVSGEHPEGPVTVHRITSGWNEGDVTWDNISGSVDSGILATIPAQPEIDVRVWVNITGQVQAWVNGEPNNGILLASTAPGIHAQYASREGSVEEHPRLEVVVGSGPASPVTIQATGTLANGLNRTLTQTGAATYQPPLIQTISPGATESADTEIWAQAPNNNYGNADETWVSSLSSDTTRTLLRFNLSRVPVGAKILHASLALQRQSGTASADPISAHRILNQWDEDSVTWNRRDSGTFWDTAGGDFNAQAIATTAVGSSNTSPEWNITTLVQGWIDNSFPNYGMMLVAENSGIVGERFYTSDQPDLTRRPSLQISYACDCGSPCMAPGGSGNILMAIGNSPSNPAASDVLIRDLFESWGYTVTYIQDDNSQGNYDAGMAGNDLVFISETVSVGNIGSKLTNAAVGIVSAEPALNDELGIATGNSSPVGATVDIVDITHFITSIFQQTTLPLQSQATEMAAASGTIAPGAQVLAQIGSDGGLVALDAGAAMSSGGSATGRRVLVPLGAGSTSWTTLSNYGHLIVQRSLAWAKGADVVPAGNLLMVVVNPGNLTSQEEAKKTLLESWGYSVSLIDESDSQGVFDAELAGNDVVFISEDVTASNVDTKLNGAMIGVVIEEDNLVDELGMAAGISWESGVDIVINDNTHYITEEFSAGPLNVFSTNESLAYTTGARATNLLELGSSSSGFGLVALESGESTHSGLIAAGRRVMLPWGGSNMDVGSLTAAGLSIMRRAIDWAASDAPDLAPLAHWKFDETSGVIAADSVGGHDGTLENGPTWAAGKLQGGLTFDGGNDFVEVPHDDTLSLAESMTFTAWVNATSYGTSYQTVISKDAGGSGSNYYFGTWQQELVFGFFANGFFREVFTTGLNLQPGSWYHLAASYSDAFVQVYLYVDGLPVESGTIGFSPTAVNAPLRIGLSPDGERWRGLLDDVRIYDRVLSATDIAEIFAEASGGPVAHWKLDDGAGTTAIDSEGGHDGTLVDGPTWAAGQLGDALNFDGSNDHLTVPHDSALAITAEITMTSWAKTDSISGGYQAILAKDIPGNGASNYWFGIRDDEVVYGFWASGSFRELRSSGAALSSGEWHHLAATFNNATDQVRLYVDGSEVATGSLAWEPTVESADVLIGRSVDGEYWDGSLDDIRIFDRILDDSEIGSLASAGGGDGGGGGGACDGTFRDEFNQEGYANNDGTLNWSTDWLEINENDGWDSGDERVVDQDSEFHLQIRDNDGGGEGVQREADLSASTQAQFSFDYRRDGFDNDRDYVDVEVSGNGGSSWTLLERIIGPGTDSSYQSRAFNISAHIAPNTRIRFLTSSNLGSGDELYIDNVEIEVSGCAN